MAKKKPPKKKSLASRYSTQVQAEGKLRYDPQRQELRSALEDLAGELTSGVKTATAASEGQKRAAIAARPQIEGAYSDANTATDRAQTDLATKMGQLPGGGQLLSGAAARDAEGTKRRLAESLASARTELTDRQTRAAEGLSLQVGNLQGRFSSEAGKLRSKLQGVAEQEGTFRQGRTAELTGEERKASRDAGQKAADRKTRLAVGGVDASGKVIPGGAKDSPKSSKASREKAGKAGADFTDQLAKAKAAVAPYVGKLPRPKIAALLSGGAPAVTESVDEKKLNRLIAANPPAGEPGHLSESELRRRATAPGAPAVAPVESSAALSAALDILLDKHLSPATVAKLRQKYPGIQIKKTGLPTRKSAPKRPKSSASNYAGGAGAGSGVAG